MRVIEVEAKHLIVMRQELEEVIADIKSKHYESAILYAKSVIEHIDHLIGEE